MIKTRKVRVCGRLFSHDKEYFVIHHLPVERDSWQNDNLDRWVVVPILPMHDNEFGSYFPHARHVVVSDYLLEYNGSNLEINVHVLDEYDLADIEAEPTNDEDIIPLEDWFNKVLAEENDE